MRLAERARKGRRSVARAVGSLRLRLLLARAKPPYRLELGARDTRRGGWVPTDVWARSRYHLDATRPWPFPSASLSHVYADNVIEHVPLDGARVLLREAFRALRPGGRIRLVTPDVERCAEVYLERGSRAREQLDAHRGAGTRVEHFVDILRAVFVEYEHRDGYAWDYESLSAELHNAGFAEIRRCELQQSDDPALSGLESRMLPIDRLTMLVVEAQRP